MTYTNGNGNGSIVLPAPQARLTKEIIRELRAPFAPQQVKWKIQTNPGEDEENPLAIVVSYVDARDVTERLDVATGGNWSNQFEEPVVRAGALPSLACALTVCGVTRIGVGTVDRPRDGEDNTKALYSDALKRAAVEFGVASHLYRFPKVKARVKKYGRSWFITFDAQDELADLNQRLIAGEPIPRKAYKHIKVQGNGWGANGRPDLFTVVDTLPEDEKGATYEEPVDDIVPEESVPEQPVADAAASRSETPDAPGADDPEEPKQKQSTRDRARRASRSRRRKATEDSASNGADPQADTPAADSADEPAPAQDTHTPTEQPDTTDDQPQAAPSSSDTAEEGETIPAKDRTSILKGAELVTGFGDDGQTGLRDLCERYGVDPEAITDEERLKAVKMGKGKVSSFLDDLRTLYQELDALQDIEE